MARTAQQQTGAGTPLAELETLLGHQFRDPALLLQAITHSSHVYEANGGRDREATDNETLEFLGDAVLGLLAAEFLWRRFPAADEGKLTQLRTSVISRRYLGAVGTRLGLRRWVRMGVAEADRSRENSTLLSNAVEALLAALYLDGGLDAARRFAEAELFAEAFPAQGFEFQAAAGQLSATVGDWKSALKEKLEFEGGGTPEYRLVGESGPAHSRIFHMEVLLGGTVLAQAEGPSKKQAQQGAARLALAQLPAAPPPVAGADTGGKARRHG